MTLSDTPAAPTTPPCDHPAGSLVPRQQGAAITCHKNLGGCGAWFYVEARSTPAGALDVHRFGHILDEHHTPFDDVPSDYYIIRWSELPVILARLSPHNREAGERCQRFRHDEHCDH